MRKQGERPPRMLYSSKPKYLGAVALIPAFLALVSCATTDLPSIGAERKPFQIEEDEKQLWKNAEYIERQIDQSGNLYKDEKLEAYLDTVAQKLFAQKVGAPGLTPRIKVIQHPFLNAFALPHGVIYLHTGILARMENEGQLAALLGHELTHFTHRHAVKQMRSEQNRAAFVFVLQVMLAAAAGAYGGGQFGQTIGQLTGEVGALWTLASVRGYSQELETEADEEGLDAIVRAGYDPKEAVKVFELLQQELDERKIQEPFFFGSHPRLQERIDNYRRLLSAQYAAQAKEAGGLRKSEEFLSRIGELLLVNAVLDLNIGRLKTAKVVIDKHLQQRPHSPRAHFLLGEVHRRSGRGEPHTQRAIAAYQESARLDPTYAEPHRELGLLYREHNRPEEARASFERYLALNPKAVDAPIIQGYLAEVRKP
jgi:predicted Zn-dependent protease